MGPVTESWQKRNGKQMLGGGRVEGTENELLRAQLLRHEADILALGRCIRRRWRDLRKRFPPKRTH